jgi:hypothetical protein
VTGDTTLDALGLRGALPCPGWVVLDAARDHRFTGELSVVVDGIDGSFRVYLDRGRIYVAERSTDPPIGIRLVEAGAINAAQLEYGTLRIGEIQHLGRLFDRVPSVNRDGVLVMNQLMTEECVRAMAARQVVEVGATPYRHHASGMHRWELHESGGGAPVSNVAPEMALPAPSPGARPVIADDSLDRPEAEERPGAATDAPSGEPGGHETTNTDARDRRRDAELFVDDVVEWDEPSLLATAAATRHRRSGHAPRDLFATAPTSTDWADDLGPGGVARDAVDTTASRAHLSPVPVRPVEQFELIWPSGETVDLAAAAPVPTEDLDTTASSARLASADRPPDFSPPHRPTSDPGDTNDTETNTGSTTGSTARSTTGEPDRRRGGGLGPAGDEHRRHDPSRDRSQDGDDDSPALAVRRAVATIDTGSLEARRRLAAAPIEPLTPPGRLVVNRDHNAWRTSELPSTSVFDEQPASFDEPRRDMTPSGGEHRGRVGALRRLIDSLRRD